MEARRNKIMSKKRLTASQDSQSIKSFKYRKNKSPLIFDIDEPYLIDLTSESVVDLTSEYFDIESSSNLDKSDEDLFEFDFWEFCLDSRHIKCDEKNYILFESAFNMQLSEVHFTYDGNLYTAYLPSTKYHIPGIPEIEVWRGGLVMYFALRSWLIQPIQVNSAIRMYEIKVSNVQDVHSREWYEYNFALDRCRAGGMTNTILQIDVYDTPLINLLFEEKKSNFKKRGISTEEVWVFHGTASVGNINAIMRDGLKAGGSDPAVPVKNGASYGHGVYSSVNFLTAAGYSKGLNKVILARALKGNCSSAGSYPLVSTHAPANYYDSWQPQPEWYVFKDGHQICPLYVIHYS